MLLYVSNLKIQCSGMSLHGSIFFILWNFLYLGCSSGCKGFLEDLLAVGGDVTYLATFEASFFLPEVLSF